MGKTNEAAPAVRQHCQGPEVTGVTVQSLSEVKDAVEVKPLTKIMRILDHFAKGGSLNRFEAERIGDHCLNTTIATLVRDYSMHFIRVPERVRSRFGADARVIRYQLSESSREAAARLLQRLSGNPKGGVE